MIYLYHELNLDKYDIADDYLRLGKQCIFDNTREMLVIKTPEEIVRQKIVCYLKDKMKVPAQMIEVEVPLSHFRKNAKGRADIVVFGMNTDEIRVPIMIVECKSPKVVLTDYTIEQATRYDCILAANTIMTTNGNFLTIRNKQGLTYRSLAKIPNYRQLISQKGLIFVENECDDWERPNFENICNEEIVENFVENGWLSESTDKKYYPFLINLAGFLQCDKNRLTPQVLHGVKIIKDGGIRFFSFGNAAGGTWAGHYRYFVIEDNKKNNQIVSISVLTTGETVNDPVFKNRKGKTTLVAAVDDFDKRHNSLQLNLDKHIVETQKVYKICHDGTLTAGKNGAVKREKVIKYVKTHAPELISNDGQILLGTFKKREEINWNEKESTDFIGRLIKYALVRDQLRRANE